MHFPSIGQTASKHAQMASANKPLTIIAGCTAFGAELGLQMSLAGFAILVIDPARDALSRLGDAFSGIRIEGEADNPEVLRQCSIEYASRLFALFDDDATNLLIGKIAETLFSVPDVRVQLMDGANRAALSGTSIQAICPAEILTARIIRELAGAPAEEA